ncbi:putative Delta(12) fatty acid desaturase [Polychaeton citri CBS 116435]|uniref:Delta(12) fatty acid desaturase n=1 Tax=Polychaeton citri CBS 116435 TaxID=1314669 RepID=A0A9P4Q0Q1_9PEZI|nr:putative Delta(12) fatty acid desaturase [Polychaeton citri CBS 116435]
MSTTALPQKAAMRRTITVDSVPSTSSNSTTGSPSDSPIASASSTSLSSLGSVEDFQQGPKQELVDTWGNEFKIPDYSIKDIRDAIPKHCFERSAITGLSYVLRDVVYLGTTFYLFNTFCTPEYVPSTPLRAGLWAVYTFLQGLFGTGLWVLAHECGHQSFSPSKTLNDTVGWFCHSSLLVPYFSWKISHGKHHKATGNMERDMVFLPRTREEHASRMGWLLHEMHELMEETPIATATSLLAQQLAGWPSYLMTNVTGHNNHEKQFEGKGKGKQNGDGTVNHFSPSSPLYERRDEKLILLSDLGLAITASILGFIGYRFGFTNLLVWYFLPYLWVNHWLVAITYLQHTDPTLPHYHAEAWTFTRGAAATIDREFGFIGRHIFHGIIETHVLHHYISTIPFYHADEATEAIKPIMGQHYRSDTQGGPVGFIKALWKSAKTCQWVEPNEGARGENEKVLFFRNRNGIGMPPSKPKKRGMTLDQ